MDIHTPREESTRLDLKVTVFSDYICPFCYIGSQRLLRLEDEYELRSDGCAMEIHPLTPPEGMSLDKLVYEPERWKQLMDSLRARAEHDGIPLAERRFTTHSHRALLLAEAARTLGRETFYCLHRALFRAFSVRHRNIGDAAELRVLAADCGIPVSLAEGAWNNPDYGERMQRCGQWALRLGVRGVPPFSSTSTLSLGPYPRQSCARSLLGPWQSASNPRKRTRCHDRIDPARRRQLAYPLPHRGRRPGQPGLLPPRLRLRAGQRHARARR